MGPGQQHAFHQTKWARTHAPCLATQGFEKPFQIQSDPSENALGAVLLQRKRPVAYFSKKLKPSEANYCVGDKELFV
jgi:hypothetical protein